MQSGDNELFSAHKTPTSTSVPPSLLRLFKGTDLFATLRHCHHTCRRFYCLPCDNTPLTSSSSIELQLAMPLNPHSHFMSQLNLFFKSLSKYRTHSYVSVKVGTIVTVEPTVEISTLNFVVDFFRLFGRFCQNLAKPYLLK